MLCFIITQGSLANESRFIIGKMFVETRVPVKKRRNLPSEGRMSFPKIAILKRYR